MKSERMTHSILCRGEKKLPFWKANKMKWKKVGTLRWYVCGEHWICDNIKAESEKLTKFCNSVHSHFPLFIAHCCFKIMQNFICISINSLQLVIIFTNNKKKTNFFFKQLNNYTHCNERNDKYLTVSEIQLVGCKNVNLNKLF